MKQPFFFATNYWEMNWLYPIAKKTGWPICAEGTALSFCEANKLETIELEQAKRGETRREIVILAIMHYGRQQEIIRAWKNAGSNVVIVQHAFDSALSVYKEFWAMDMGLFDKYLVASQFDYDLLYPLHGNKIKLTGSPRLHMATQVLKRNRKKILDRIGTGKFYLATVVGDEPIHENGTEDAVLTIGKYLPHKVVFKFHSGANHNYYQDKYPDNFFWHDNPNNPWETYELISASQGIITPSSFMAIEATIMGKPVIRVGKMSQEELRRQWEQKQVSRLPDTMFSQVNNPTFTQEQQKMATNYIYDKQALDRVIKEIEELQ